MKKMIGVILLASIAISCIGNQVAYAAEYRYDIPTCSADQTFRTRESLQKRDGQDYLANNLQVNESTHQLYFKVAKVDGWVEATDAHWQSSGTIYNYSYYESYRNSIMDVKLCFRRDTNDTYSGTRHVYGWWGNGTY